MSAFGYGSSYGRQPTLMVGDPYSQQQNASQGIPAWANQGINFAPEVTQPLATAGYRTSTMKEGEKYTPNPNITPRHLIQNSWQNPLATNFGGAQSLSGNIKSTALGIGPTSFDPMAAQQQLPGPKGTQLGNVSIPAPNSAGYTPKTFDQLYAQIQSLTPEQLQNIDLAGTYMNQFGSAAQDYTNAFANPAYANAKSPGGAQWNQGNVNNWLQSAYVQLMQRLGDAYLL